MINFHALAVAVLLAVAVPVHGALLGPEDEGDCHCNPDPHFRTFDRNYYDYHGGCDVVLVKNSLLDLHIRTVPTVGYAYISHVAMKVGGETLEVIADMSPTCTIDSTSCTTPPATVGGYPVTVSSVGVYEVNVSLDNGQYVRVLAYANSLSVQVHAHGSDFLSTRGMCGPWGSPDIHLRDGSIASDPTALAIDWRVGNDVADPDPTLFSSAGNLECKPALTSQDCVAENKDGQCPSCQLEGGIDKEGIHCCPKREGEVCPTKEAVVAACGDVIDDNLRANCEFDIRITGEVELWTRNSPIYRNVPPPVLPDPRCESEDEMELGEDASENRCMFQGGICVSNCVQDLKSRCISELCGRDNCFCKILKTSWVDYKRFGKLHNDILDKISEDISFPEICSSRDGMKQLVEKTTLYAIDLFKESPQYDVEAVGAITFSNILEAQHIILNLADFEKLGKYLVKKEYITQKEAVWFKKLNKAVKGTRNKFTKLEKFETKVKKNKRISERTRGALLMGSAVMRKSGEYWEAASNEDNLWYDINKQRNSKNKRRMHWFIRDGMGAVGGFILGFIVAGPIGGGVGAAAAGAAASCLG